MCVRLVTESVLQQQKKRLEPVSLPSFQEFLSTRGVGGVLGGFGDAIPGNEAPGGQRLDARRQCVWVVIARPGIWWRIRTCASCIDT
jgi:hypothetical protein